MVWQEILWPCCLCIIWQKQNFGNVEVWLFSNLERDKNKTNKKKTPKKNNTHTKTKQRSI